MTKKPQSQPQPGTQPQTQQQTPAQPGEQSQTQAQVQPEPQSLSQLIKEAGTTIGGSSAVGTAIFWLLGRMYMSGLRSTLGLSFVLIDISSTSYIEAGWTLLWIIIPIS